MIDRRPSFHSAMTIFTDSIDVCAVAVIGDALYKDIRLSGNQLRAPRTPWITRQSARLRG